MRAFKVAGYQGDGEGWREGGVCRESSELGLAAM